MITDHSDAIIEAHGAISRDGATAPHGPAAAIPSIDGKTVTELIWAAEDLQRIARDWQSDPAWPSLRSRLEAAYAELCDEYRPTHAMAWRKARIEHLLGLPKGLMGAEK